jgi:hypothetical protein
MFHPIFLLEVVAVHLQLVATVHLQVVTAVLVRPLRFLDCQQPMPGVVAVRLKLLLGQVVLAVAVTVESSLDRQEVLEPQTRVEAVVVFTQTIRAQETQAALVS